MFTILWDNDGVLVDTEDLYFQATKTVLHTIGIDPTPDQYKDISLRRGESMFNLAAEQNIDSDRIAGLRAERDRLYIQLLGSQSLAIDGAEEVLHFFHGRMRMGVVTSTCREHFDIAHAKAGLAKYLDFVITQDDYEHTKPHPDPYLTAMARHNLRREECIVVEDSERGLAAATAAGLPCLIVLSEWTRDGDFRTACKVLNSIREVPDEIMKRVSSGLRSVPSPSRLSDPARCPGLRPGNPAG
jgi:HAD superfamily hydrolase (TIGR01509 family)